jgi:hypothetical protein
MKFYTVRALAFGFGCSAAAGAVVGGMAQLASLPYVPDPFAWPFLLFILGGYPLSALLELLPGFEHLQWAVFPQGGAGGVFANILFASLITWAIVFAFCRHLWLRKHGPGPNNSFKPKPLRGSA